MSSSGNFYAAKCSNVQYSMYVRYNMIGRLNLSNPIQKHCMCNLMNTCVQFGGFRHVSYLSLSLQACSIIFCNNIFDLSLYYQLVLINNPVYYILGNVMVIRGLYAVLQLITVLITFMTDVITLLGNSDKSAVTQAVSDVVDFEKSLAKVSLAKKWSTCKCTCGACISKTIQFSKDNCLV